MRTQRLGAAVAAALGEGHRMRSRAKVMTISGLTKIRSGHCRLAVIDGIAERTPNFRAS